MGLCPAVQRRMISSDSLEARVQRLSNRRMWRLRFGRDDVFRLGGGVVHTRRRRLTAGPQRLGVQVKPLALLGIATDLANDFQYRPAVQVQYHARANGALLEATTVDGQIG